MLLVLVRDLLFVSKITATARAAANPPLLALLRDPANLAEQPPGARRLILDANLPGTIQAAAAYKCRSPSTAIVAFVAHTDAQTIALAREGGIEKLLARSAFFDHLDSFLD